MAGGNSHEIWKRFVEADYLRDACNYEGNCPACNSSRDCNNYYCLQCMVGGLCPTAFRADGEHNRHPWLQVRRQSRLSAVDPEELAKFIGQESTKHIQEFLLNKGSLCYLRTKGLECSSNSSQRNDAAGSSAEQAKSPPICRGRLERCAGCRIPIPKSQDCNEEFLVCSLQCLITVAQGHPERNLLQIRDGAMDLTDVFPLTALEKINGRQINRGPRAPASTSRAPAVNDRPGGESVLAEPVARASRSRRAPVNYRELHRGGSASAIAEGPRRPGGSRRRRTAGRIQAPDDTELPSNDLRNVLLHCIDVAKDIGDWELFLGDLVRNYTS